MKTFFTFLLVIIGLNLSAQIDLSITIVNPEEGAELPAGPPVSVDVELTNWVDILPENDTLYMGFVLNDVFYGPTWGILLGASVAGGGVSFPVDDVTSFTGLDDGVYTLCAWIMGVGSVESGRNFELAGLEHAESIGDITISDIATGDPTPENNEHCISFIVGDTTTIDDVGIQNSFEDEVTIFPNPANDFLIVNGADGGAEVVVMDLNGQVVLKQLISGTETLDISNIANGMYVLQLFDQNGDIIKNEKIVIRE